MTSDYWLEHESKIRWTIWAITWRLLIASLFLIFPFIDTLRVGGESVATWWQRSGAPIAVFAFLAQNKASWLKSLLSAGSFGSEELTELRKKYYRWQVRGNNAAIVLTVVGTIVWGYGDKLLVVVNPAFAVVK